MNAKVLAIIAVLAIVAILVTSLRTPSPITAPLTPIGENDQALSTDELSSIYRQDKSNVGEQEQPVTPTAVANTITGPQRVTPESGRSPGEILDDAQTALANLYQFKATVSIQSQVNGSQTQSTVQVWFEQPNSFRIQLPQAVGGVLAQGTTFVTDGTRLLAYSQETDQAILVNQFPQVRILLDIPGDGSLPILEIIQLRATLQSLANQTTMQSRGPELLAGRPSQVIELRPQNTDTQFTRALLWVDEATNLPMRLQFEGADGQIVSAVQFLSIDSTASIPSGTFSLAAPQEAQVSTLTLPDITALIDAGSTTLDEARQRVNFTLFALPKLPPTADEQDIKTATVNGQTVAVLFYGTADTVSTMIIETASSQQLTSLPLTELTTVNDYSAQLGQIGDTTIVMWTQNDTAIILASTLGKVDTLSLAKSLQPIQ